jgi:hypothetical protein
MSEEAFRQILRADGLTALKKYVMNKCSTLLDHTNDYGDFLLHIAAKMDLDFFKFVYDMHPHAIEYENANAYTPAGCSVNLGTPEALEILRFVAEVAPENLNWVSRRNGMTLLHMAAQEGHEKIVQFLIVFLDMNKPDDHKWTPIGNAMYHNHANVIRVLLDDGADPWILQGAHERTLQCIGKVYRSHAALGVFDEWNTKTWQIRDHSTFPIHFRKRMVAVAVSLAHVAPVLDHIANAFVALMREKPLVI